LFTNATHELPAFDLCETHDDRVGSSPPYEPGVPLLRSQLGITTGLAFGTTVALRLDGDHPGVRLVAADATDCATAPTLENPSSEVWDFGHIQYLPAPALLMGATFLDDGVSVTQVTSSLTGLAPLPAVCCAPPPADPRTPPSSPSLP
jgi:hypothetical protein